MKPPGFYGFQRIVLLCGFALLLSGVSGSTPGKQQRRSGAAQKVKSRLVKVFGLCRSGNAGEAAAYFVYRGADKSREWKDTFRASDAAEKAEVGEVCRRIKGYLDKSEGYRFGEVKMEREREGVWHVLEVSFQQGGNIKKVLFAFLIIKGQFSIGDIDE